VVTTTTTENNAENGPAPAAGSLVQVRGSTWVVSEAESAGTGPSGTGRATNTLVSLQSVEDGRYDDTLEVIWEVEPGRRVLPAGALPGIAAGRFDRPEHLAAFLDAIRWSAVTSVDQRTLQSPFRSGVAIEDYQLEPVLRAVDAPRVNLLLADDVGLGKTIEAGLVAQELLLRHRASRIMVVCPAGLTAKWRDELQEKFGLEFTVIDAECCARVRLTHGSAANPFQVHQRSIVSLAWLRGAKAQRLLDEVLPVGDPGPRRTFDLLILDEAHHVAPAAPKQVYAVDSRQTKLIRRLAPHFTHRLFLSATPHNGYQESFTALLEILDDQRFARGVEPDPTAVGQTVIRRLKEQIVEADGSRRFRERRAMAIPVVYPPDEQNVHGLLADFAALRRRAARSTGRRGRRATDLVTLLLKKRLFSSPAAFEHTVAVFRETLESRRGRPLAAGDPDAVPAWLEEFDEFTSCLDDDELADAEDDALDRSAPLGPDPLQDESDLLDRMGAWATTYRSRPDAKARALLDHLQEVCRTPDGGWTDERVVVFTEYRDTQDWLADLFSQHSLAGERLALLHGQIPLEDREHIRLAFQAHPAEQPVRILLATDSAGEGIDLQNHCCRLINYDIPFNPNKLEQRIGRVDRYGQRRDVEVRHFVGSGWARGSNTFEADLEFLSRVALKVSRMQADLGPVNAVLSEAVQRRMLGGTVTAQDVDAVTSARPGTGTAGRAGDPTVSEQVRRATERLNRTIADLGLTPPAVHRVVSTALALARQQPLAPVRLAPGSPATHPLAPDTGSDAPSGPEVFEVPTLTGSWQRAAEGLIEKLPRRGEAPRQRPVTFDAAAAAGRDDVVLAHLNHPLVAMSLRLLRGAASHGTVELNRVTAVLSDDPRVDEVIVAAYSRFVLVGSDGIRLHEEVLHAGGRLPADGRFARIERLGELAEILDDALARGVPASDPVRDRLLQRWTLAERRLRAEEGLVPAVHWRARIRQEALASRLEQRRLAEREQIADTLDRFADGLRRALEPDPQQDEDALFSQTEITRTREELAQYRRDRQAWAERLERLQDEREREFAAIDHRYADPQPHVFPVAVVFVIPRQEAVR